MAPRYYRVAAVGSQLGIGVAGSIHLRIDAVGKENGTNAPYCIPNELICAQLATHLRLPVPPSALVKSTSVAPMFASLNFNMSGNSLPPADPARCYSLSPIYSTGLLLFDILVANSDRHAGNLAIDAASKPPQLHIFDHSHALLGNAQDRGVDRLHAMTDRLAVTGGLFTGGNRHCLLDVVDSDRHFPLWIDRITKLPDFQIEEACIDARPLGLSAPETDACERFLKRRRDEYAKLINDNRSEFSAIATWNLV